MNTPATRIWSTSFCFGRQTRVFLFLDLSVIIHQTDRAVGHGKAEHRQRRDRNLTHQRYCPIMTAAAIPIMNIKPPIVGIFCLFMCHFGPISRYLLTEFHFAQIVDDRRTDSQL